MWALAGVTAGAPPLDAFRVGGVEMTVVAAFVPVLWWLTGRYPLRPRRQTFLLAHFAAATALVLAYSMAQGLAFHGTETFLRALTSSFSSAVAGWNIFIGTFVYLATVGALYAARAEIALRESERARAEAKVAARDAQLAALSAQLQPHFLFNALHTVGSLVHTDAEQADRALDDLGQLLRYALRPPTDDVLLRDDWSFARDYLAFERLRLGDRLRIVTRIDDSALDVRVPPFTIQPLVENAVLHGIAPTTQSGDVSIEIRHAGDVIAIGVVNSVAVPRTNGRGATGNSLARLRQRLELRFGDSRSRVEVDESEGRFHVTVSLPA